METINQQEMVLISKIELKDLIKSSTREELNNFTKYEEVSSEEQKEIEKLHFDIEKDIFNKKDYVEI